MNLVTVSFLEIAVLEFILLIILFYLKKIYEGKREKYEPAYLIKVTSKENLKNKKILKNKTR